MKKTITIMLVAMMLVLTACGAQTPAAADPAPVASAEATQQAEVTPVEQATEEAAAEEAALAGVEQQQAYGEQTLMEADQNGFAAEIAYPSGFEELDAALEAWADALLKDYEAKSAQEAADADGMKAQMFVAYSSYELGVRYVGVKELGAYFGNASGSAESIVYTTNFDSDKTKLLTLDDVIAPAHTDAVAALLTEKLNESGNIGLLGGASAVTAAAMQNFVVTDTGVEFLFSDGGTGYAECLLPYEQINPYLALYDTVETAAPGTTPAPAAAEKPVALEEATCVANGVHIRAAADEKATALAVLQKGAAVEVVRKDAGNGFSEIWYDGQMAYVWTAYLYFADSTASAGELPEVTAIGYVTGGSVHVREEASTKSKVLGTLTLDDEVKIVAVEYKDNWHQILYKDQIAYISARYVSIGKEPASTPKPALADPKIVSGPPYIEFVGTCTTNGVIIRSKTSTKADYYGKLANGDQVQVVESEFRSGWDKVWIPTNNANTRGYIGYVHSKYIEDWSTVVPVVQTSNPVVPVLTPIPVITSSSAQIGSGVTVNP